MLRVLGRGQRQWQLRDQEPWNKGERLAHSLYLSPTPDTNYSQFPLKVAYDPSSQPGTQTCSTLLPQCTATQTHKEGWARRVQSWPRRRNILPESSRFPECIGRDGEGLCTQFLSCSLWRGMDGVVMENVPSDTWVQRHLGWRGLPGPHSPCHWS